MSDDDFDFFAPDVAGAGQNPMTPEGEGLHADAEADAEADKVPIGGSLRSPICSQFTPSFCKRSRNCSHFTPFTFPLVLPVPCRKTAT